jgi:prophage maintenance system killer protein
MSSGSPGRTHFMTGTSGSVFLERNGWRLEASEPDIVETQTALAAGELSEEALTAWIMSRAQRRRRR